MARPTTDPIVLLLSLLLFGTASAGDTHDKRSTPCERTAQSMFKACLFDLGNEQHTTIANCRNIADGALREECFASAGAVRKEEAESCHEVWEARENACEVLGEVRYDPDPLLSLASAFIDPNDIPAVYEPNPYVSLVSGHTYVLRAGADPEETVVVHVTNDTREILGVACRIVIDIVLEVVDNGGSIEYEAVEVTDDWFAQDTEGNVYYCGEVSRNYEDGILADIGGSFEAGRDFAKAGDLFRAYPVAGAAHRQEFALGEAEDIIQYVDIGTAPTAEEGGDHSSFPCSPNLCVKTYDFTPIQPESAEFKYYLPGTGFVLAVGLEDGELTGEREELMCVGPSLDVLEDPDCGIADPSALLAQLCELAPGVFCAE